MDRDEADYYDKLSQTHPDLDVRNAARESFRAIVRAPSKEEKRKDAEDARSESDAALVSFTRALAAVAGIVILLVGASKGEPVSLKDGYVVYGVGLLVYAAGGGKLKDLIAKGAKE